MFLVEFKKKIMFYTVNSLVLSCLASVVFTDCVLFNLTLKHWKYGKARETSILLLMEILRKN